MRLNNKGFAITTILYGMLILFMLLFVSLLGILAQYKNNLEKLVENTNGARDIANRKRVSSTELGSDMLVSKSNVESLTYANATDEQKKEMWAFSHPATSQVGATTDYRYIGSNPNNYIIFNGETWRIIGVFDGKIKIIRQDSLGELYWDKKKINVGSSKSNYGSNDWTDSQLMYMLNSNWLKAGSEILKPGNTFDGTYVKDSNGKIIYQKGCLPAGASGTTYTCTSNTWSLNNTASSQVEKVTYYLGGSSKASSSGPESYAFERGVKVPTN